MPKIKSREKTEASEMYRVEEVRLDGAELLCVMPRIYFPPYSPTVLANQRQMPVHIRLNIE